MKFITLLVLVYLSAAAPFLFGQSPPRRHALLIGISEYSRPGAEADDEWWDLNSSGDVSALGQTLQNKFNFKSGEIRVLRTRRETTRQAILNALNELAATVKPGDIVYLHYSGHGAQVLDDNGDEIDGLDESIVPSDYISRDDGAKNIRDDEIGKFLDALRAKQPASVTFTFDSCFSGTVTRGGRQLARGDKYRGKTPVAAPANVNRQEDSSGLLAKDSLGKNFIIISATRSDQTAKETDTDNQQKMGALTYSLIKAFSEAGAQTTYRDIFERVQYFVSAKTSEQDPQIEGEIDAVLLKGTANPPEPYIGVKLDEKKNLILQAGALQGMTKGSKFAIYPNGTKLTAGAVKIADAEIAETDATTSLLQLEAGVRSKVKPEMLQTARAFETEHKYGETLLNVAFAGENKVPQEKAIIGELSSFPLVGITEKDNWDVRISPQEKDLTRGGGGEATILLERADGSMLAEIESDEKLARNIRLALEREARFRTILKLENNSPDLNVELRIVPVEVEQNMRGAVTKIVRDKPLVPGSSGKTQIAEGSYVALEIRNKGYLDAYVTILDLTADGKIGALFPHPKVAMPDNKIPADGEWKRLPLPFVFRITPPVGTEIYKVIATREPADFSPLLDVRIVRGTEARVGTAAQSPLGKILRSATLTQRSEIGGASPPNWATATVTFEVVRK